MTSSTERDTDWRKFVKLSRDEQIKDLAARWKDAEAERDTLRSQLARAEPVIQWAQTTLTALNVGDVQSESLLHKKLREVMIAYRACHPRHPNGE